MISGRFGERSEFLNTQKRLGAFERLAATSEPPVDLLLVGSSRQSRIAHE
jgi:hypothetical protein